jgi:hypothetical protein
VPEIRPKIVCPLILMQANVAISTTQKIRSSGEKERRKLLGSCIDVIPPNVVTVGVALDQTAVKSSPCTRRDY